MRNISSQALDALNTGRFGTRTLVKMSAAGVDPLCIWDDVGSLDYGGDTYVGKAGRFTVSPAPSVMDLSVSGYEVQFSGLDAEVITLLNDTAWSQQPIVIYRAIFAIDTPQIILVHTEFSGFMDFMTWTEGADGSPSRLLLQCESASRELSLSGSRTASDADQRERDSADGFFSFAATAVTSNIDWGRSLQQSAAPAKPKGIAGIISSLF